MSGFGGGEGHLAERQGFELASTLWFNAEALEAPGREQVRTMGRALEGGKIAPWSLADPPPGGSRGAA